MITTIDKPFIKISSNTNGGNTSNIVQKLNKYKLDFPHRIGDPSEIFYFEADDDQMRYFGIRKNSVIVVDRSIEINNNNIIVCCVDGEWLTRKMVLKGASTFLCINDHMDACLNITGKQVEILGAVTWVCQPQYER